jgi:hypothetical protein
LEHCVNNVTLNRVMATLADAEQSATRKRVEAMFGSTNESVPAGAAAGVLTILQQHIRVSVDQFDAHFAGVATRRDREKSFIRSSGSSDAMKGLDECDRRYEACVKYLMESYESFLSECTVTPSLLPLRVTVSVAHKPALSWTVNVMQTDTESQLMQLVTSRLSELGENIVDLGPDAHFKVKRAFEHALASSEATPSCVLGKTQPIGELHLDPGATFELGGITLRSDMPKVCFAKVFDANDPSQTTDYFSCKTCDLNWVCEGCASSCHSGHDLQPFLGDHRPTWACCYCSKKKKKQCHFCR